MCVNAPEYLEAFFAAQKLGAVPVNVNYRYVGAELAYLLDNSDSVALVFHDDFAATVADALATLPADRRPRAAAPGRARRRAASCSTARATTTAAIAAAPAGRADRRASRRATTSCSSTPAAPPAARRPSCGAATTSTCRCGRWRGRAPSRPTSRPRCAPTSAPRRCLPACPLMHGTGLFIALSTLGGRRHGRAARHAAPRRRRGVGRGRARARAGVHDRRRRVRAPAARRARRRAEPLGSLAACARSRRRASRGARRRSAACSRTCRT